MSTVLFLLTLFGVCLLAYANGTNDISKATATLLGSGVASYRRAVLWGAVCTLGGAWLGGTLATAMVQTFTTGMLVEAKALPLPFPVAVLLGASFWVLLASRLGLPVSTTHALVGALCGAALTPLGKGGILWLALGERVLAPLAFSPFLALLLTLGVSPAVYHVLGRWKGSCLCATVVQDVSVPVGNLAQRAATLTPPQMVLVYDVPKNCGRGKGIAVRLDPNTVHWLSGGLVSFARALNDAPKIVAPATILFPLAGDSLSLGPLLFPLVALAMSAGSLWGGFRVTQSLAEKVTEVDPLGGLSANLSTALLVTAAALVGLPLSTTHVSSGAIVGVGLGRGRRQVCWQTVGRFLLAWLVTLPAAGVLAALALWALG